MTSDQRRAEANPSDLAFSVARRWRYLIEIDSGSYRPLAVAIDAAIHKANAGNAAKLKAIEAWAESVGQAGLAPGRKGQLLAIINTEGESDAGNGS